MEAAIPHRLDVAAEHEWVARFVQPERRDVVRVGGEAALCPELREPSVVERAANRERRLGGVRERPAEVPDADSTCRCRGEVEPDRGTRAGETVRHPAGEAEAQPLPDAADDGALADRAYREGPNAADRDPEPRPIRLGNVDAGELTCRGELRARLGERPRTDRCV